MINIEIEICVFHWFTNGVYASQPLIDTVVITAATPIFHIFKVCVKYFALFVDFCHLTNYVTTQQSSKIEVIPIIQEEVKKLLKTVVNHSYCNRFFYTDKINLKRHNFFIIVFDSFFTINHNNYKLLIIIIMIPTKINVRQLMEYYKCSLRWICTCTTNFFLLCSYDKILNGI